MILFSHPLSTPFTREAALALADAGLLAELRTCLHWTPGNPAERFLPAGLAREMGRRSYPPAVGAPGRPAPGRGAGALARTRELLEVLGDQEQVEAERAAVRADAEAAVSAAEQREAAARRERLGRGEPCVDLLPPLVSAYIQQQGLYRAALQGSGAEPGEPLG